MLARSAITKELTIFLIEVIYFQWVMEFMQRSWGFDNVSQCGRAPIMGRSICSAAEEKQIPPPRYGMTNQKSNDKS
jgi:hypothetical protein